MGRLLILLLAILALPFALQAAEPTVTRQELAVTLYPEAQTLEGECRLLLAPSDGLQLTLAISPHAVIRQLTIDGATPPYDFDNGRLTVRLPDRRPGTTVLVVAYAARFAAPLPKDIVSFDDPSFGVTGVITPQGTFLDAAAGWYPATEEPPGLLRVTVQAPAGIEAITQGRRLARATADGVTTSTWETRLPSRDLALSAGPYEVVESREGDIDLYTYLLPANRELAAGYLESVREHLRFYQGLLGPYPFEKFAVVENFLPTGYGYPSYTLLGSGVIRLPFIRATSLPHEIVHCWWGNGVLVDYAKGNWCEGLATYLADHLLAERRSREEGRDYRFRLLVDYAAMAASGKDLPLRSFTGRHDFATKAVGYGKGAMVYHMARTAMGDDAFFAGLRLLARSHMFRTATWDDVIAALSKAAGRDLRPALLPWIQEAGAPLFSLSEVSAERQGSGWRVQGVVQLQGGPVPAGIPLALETERGSVKRTVTLAGRRTPFSIDSVAAPKRLALDPDVDLFRLLPPAEIPPAVSRLKGSDALILVATAGCRADAATLRQLLQSLGKANAAIITEEALTPSLAANHDLIVCGLPGRPQLLPLLPPTIRAEAHAFVVEGTRYTSPSHLLLAVGGHPGAPDRVTALFLPLSPQAAQLGVRKITHYGKYGYLVFDSGENRGKGTLPAAGSGSIHLFSPL
jgi:aminopeptidase N